MFLNQVHYITNELRHSSGLRTAALVLGPLIVFGLLAIVLRLVH